MTRNSATVAYLLTYGGAVFAQVIGSVGSQWTPLTCPICEFRFSWRDYSRAGKACPKCRLPLGMPSYYRAILAVAYLSVSGLTMYVGYQKIGTGWLLLGVPFAVILGFLVQVIILRIFPPKLQAYAEGDTWLKLK